MALFQGIRYNLQDITPTVVIPNTATGKLMYYINIVCKLLELEDNQDMQKYKDFEKHNEMNKVDKNLIILLCVMFDPRILLNRVLFLKEDIGERDCVILSVNQVKTTVAAVDTIIIGGVSSNVQNIMFFKEKWLVDNYLSPLEKLVEELRRPEPKAIENKKDENKLNESKSSSSCTIL